jgi:hypothetical protein
VISITVPLAYQSRPSVSSPRPPSTHADSPKRLRRQARDWTQVGDKDRKLG